MSGTNIPIEKWGHDHWSTLAYIECRCVDHGGKLRNANMRTDYQRHPLLLDRCGLGDPRGAKYPTRLADGSEQANHDDWDCLNDMAAAGLLTVLRPSDPELWDVEPGKRGRMSGFMEQPLPLEVVVSLTPLGHFVASRLRRHRAETGRYKDFDPKGGKIVAWN
jgi:hypothetical protein